MSDGNNILSLFSREEIKLLTKGYRDENGQRHNDHGPAMLNVTGSLLYFKHGMFHREDGPAIVQANGNVFYYFNNKQLSDADEMSWFDKGYLTDEEKTLLTLKYR